MRKMTHMTICQEFKPSSCKALIAHIIQGQIKTDSSIIQLVNKKAKIT